jgi:hypothetical protein
MSDRISFVSAGLCSAASMTIGFSTAVAQVAGLRGSQEKSVHVVRSDTPPVIDGMLDDEVWRQAATISDLHEIQPTEYAEPSEPTLIYLLYDSDAIYIGAQMYDSNPALVTDRILRQGEQVFGDDWISVILDTFHDRRSGYRFFTNPNGIRQEGIYQNVTETEWDWQGIWQAAAKINEEGWAAEMAIPFKTISFDPENDTWGINFRRSIARRDERIGWVSRNRNTDPSVSGIAVGFEGLQQGMGLDVIPSMSLTERRRFDASGGTTDGDPSLDVFYKISPSLTSSLTINTDFSATEVDDRQVNLTRFGLFFPEKRDFFLQDADIFEFGGLDENGRPFFSRRIGLSETGEPVDLEVGGKISGRIGRFNIGALAIRQDEFGDVAADNALVSRVSANVLEESTVGLIATEGDPSSNVDNSVVGADFAYRNTRLAAGRLLESNAWMQQSDTPGLTGDDQAYGLGVQIPNSIGLGGGFRFSHLEENFKPALGFVNRLGIDQYNIGMQYRIRPREGYLRLIEAGINARRVQRIADGELESQRVRLRLTQLESRQGDELQFDHATNKEVLFEGFEISEGVVIPVGSYTFDEFRIELETADQRKVWGNLNVRRGDFYSGTRDEIEASIAWRPSGRLFTELGYQYNEIDLPEGAFETRLAQFRTEVVFSSTLSWVTLIQYDNVSETIGINSRVHWIPEAGREAFVVLNHNLQDLDRDNEFHSSFAEAAIKFNYTFRF